EVRRWPSWLFVVIAPGCAAQLEWCREDSVRTPEGQSTEESNKAGTDKKQSATVVWVLCPGENGGDHTRDTKEEDGSCEKAQDDRHSLANLNHRFPRGQARSKRLGRLTPGVTCGLDRRAACSFCKTRDGTDRQVDADVRPLTRLDTTAPRSPLG